jgi:hypothetical protein
VFGELIAWSTELSFRDWREMQIFGGPCCGVVAEFVIYELLEMLGGPSVACPSA